MAGITQKAGYLRFQYGLFKKEWLVKVTWKQLERY